MNMSLNSISGNGNMAGSSIKKSVQKDKTDENPGISTEDKLVSYMDGSGEISEADIKKTIDNLRKNVKPADPNKMTERERKLMLSDVAELAFGLTGTAAAVGLVGMAVFSSVPMLIGGTAVAAALGVATLVLNHVSYGISGH